MADMLILHTQKFDDIVKIDKEESSFDSCQHDIYCSLKRPRCILPCKRHGCEAAEAMMRREKGLVFPFLGSFNVPMSTFDV